ncbi:hypothetical protein CJ178_31525 [Rhodococcus sp. ACPA4]|uniref:hypothetical protein n=1 Tax=Rhodococcus sp. ACPA4 TaxID=2028571 RepID=UPI000BB0D07A|nr:hypothetical protein [Rhodococcus sp. ACPA4]PBC35956.1 hypothetical protein CJ178_31525 [Rhodococcus sp. ACPA4]
MILKLQSVDHQGLSHIICQVGDLSRLNVDVPSGTPYTEISGYLETAQLGAGTPADDSTVFLNIESLTREFAERANTTELGGFDRLIDHARARGWLDSACAMVRVRLVYY